MLSIKKNSRFREVYRGGKSFAARHLVLCVLGNGGAENRLGVSVSGKVGNSVTRNRVKRLVKESFRVLCGETAVEKGFDLVVIARVPSSEATFWDIKKELKNLLKRHKLLVTERINPFPADAMP